MSQLCISYSLSTKLIGSFGVTISTFMLSKLVSEFLLSQKPDIFTDAVESWILFGLNWTHFVKNHNSHYQGYYLLICVLFYIGCYLSVNLMLCFASVMKIPDFLLPWICFQIFSIADQVLAIVIHLTDEDSQFFTKSIWIIPISSCYLILSAYFLVNVCLARKAWIAYPRENPISTISRSYETSQGSNLPKSPSYLSDQDCFKQSPKCLSELSDVFKEV